MFRLIPLGLVPAPLHRLAYRIAHGLRTRWWQLRRPVLIGCRMLALDGEGRVLLIRHSYGSRKWMLPGGGVGRREDPVLAAARELHEETRCRFDDPREIALIEEPLYGARNLVHVIAGGTADSPVADGREIVDARFFAQDAIPEDIPRSLRANLPGWLTAAEAGRRPPPGQPPGPPPSPPPSPTA